MLANRVRMVNKKKVYPIYELPGGEYQEEGASSYIKTPHTNNVKSVMLNIFITSEQSGGLWKYMLDFREPEGKELNSNPYIASNGSYSGFDTAYIDDEEAINIKTAISELPKERWIWLYFELVEPVNAGVVVFSNAKLMEPLSGKIKGIMLWDKKLSLKEFKSFQDVHKINNESLLAHFPSPRSTTTEVRDRLGGASGLAYKSIIKRGEQSV